MNDEPKFKVGDRVVVTSSVFSEFVGRPDVVVVITTGSGLIYRLRDFLSAREDWLEFEDVYNSPLYQALK